MKHLGILFFTMVLRHSAITQVQIHSFEDIELRLLQNNHSIKSGELALDKARKSRLAALMSVPDPTGNVSLGYTNNTRLPVTVFPAEILGGTPGTYEKIALGLQYTTNFNAAIDIKLINLAGIENLKLSKLNIQLNESDNTIQIKNLLENAAITYYNILTLQAQLHSTEEQVEKASQLKRTVQNKVDVGLATVQELNEAQITLLNYQDNLKQIEYQIRLQVNTLNVLMELENFNEVEFIPTDETVDQEYIEPINRKFNEHNNSLKYRIAQIEYRKEKKSYLPTLSFNIGQQRQLFDKQSNPFNSNQDWVPSSYYGFKLSMPIPGTNQINAYYKTRYQQRISLVDLEHARIQDELSLSNLMTNYEKAKSEWESAEKILLLRIDTYDKNLINYEADLVSLAYTIDSFNAMVNARYAATAARYKVQLQRQTILINNQVK